PFVGHQSLQPPPITTQSTLTQTNSQRKNQIPNCKIIPKIACTYAAFVLHDDGIAVTAEKIATLVQTMNLTVESYWPSLFAKLCEKNIEDLVMNVHYKKTANFRGIFRGNEIPSKFSEGTPREIKIPRFFPREFLSLGKSLGNQGAKCSRHVYRTKNRGMNDG
ncbi:60S acidic ribosomal protein p1, partial [Phtheirospermum japonicum]